MSSNCDAEEAKNYATWPESEERVFIHLRRGAGFCQKRTQTTRLASYFMTLPPRVRVCCARECSPRVHTVSKILNKRRIFHLLIVTF